MRQTVYSDTVRCPPEEVWAFLADLRNDKAWRFEVDAVELLSGSPPLAPAIYREHLRWAGLHAEALLEVTQSSRGDALVVEVRGEGYSSRSAWRFEPHQNGTLVTLHFSLEATVAMGMTEPIVWKLADGWLSRDLPLLQGHLSCT